MDEIWPKASSGVDSVQLYEVDQFQLASKQAQKNGKAWVVLNMVSSLDGSATYSGLSGGLGSKGDKLIFNSLRAAADFILVGANTARDEKYGAPQLAPEIQDRRLARGQQRVPPLVLVSRSLSFEEEEENDVEFLNDSPIIYTTQNAPAQKKSALEKRAEIRIAGTDSVDLSQVVSELAGQMILVEGGPTLNGQLLEAGLLDELCLTISPVIVGEGGPHIINGNLDIPENMNLVWVLTDEDSMLYLKLQRS